MIFSNDRTALRRTFQTAWQKRVEGKPLEPLEAIIADVIALHPEYQRIVQQPDALDRDWSPELGETNPFLHMGMHIALHEQLAARRPAGINEAYSAALMKLGDPHAVEHRFMECLGETLWQAQRNGTPPDDVSYLRCLQAINQ
ncbi:MAG: DUF1841 family protein [Hydrogenophaga sp.]